MDTVYREIREFGISLVLLDQMPSKLSGFALANSYATVCMSMSNRADINAMSQSLLLDSSKDVLGTLDVGQAVVKLQGRIQKPFLISIPEFKITKGRMTDADIREHMQRLVPDIMDEMTHTNGDSEDTKPADQPSGPLPGSNKPEIEFLRDIEQYPDSGVAARYKRLGLSARQGQRIKANLLEEGRLRISLAPRRPAD